MSRRREFFLLGSILLAGTLIIAWMWRERQAPQTATAVLSSPDQTNGAPLTVARAIQDPGSEGFKQVTQPRTFSFPADHGPHPEYRTEWWYYTGNLRAADGRQFGYQLTFFRQGLTPTPVQRASHWATRDVYLAHFGLTDASGKQFYAADRLNRAAATCCAGASAEPYRVFVESWSAEGTGATARLRASDKNIAIDLQVRAVKPPTLQGNNGLSQKGAAVGNASYYYSFTRMETTGAITVEGQSIPVQGLSWFDREWGTSALGKDQVGWDWFSFQLGDGRDLMWYQFRHPDGTADTTYSQGTITAGAGKVDRVRDQDVQVDVLDTWVSPATKARYPARWRLRIPKAGLDLEVRPLLADQELKVGFRYWEGAVTVTGTSNGQPISGHGYVELTGYADVSQAAR
jgi:predicted secreted hydrolase